MELRRATNGDVVAVCDLVASVLEEYGLAFDAGGKDRDLQDIEAAYLSRQGEFLVLVERDEVKGCGGIFDLGDRICELRKMYLLPSARGRGEGLRLLRELVSSAKRLGFRAVRLETHKALTEAIRLYERFGFRPIALAGGPTTRVDQAWELPLY